MNRIYLEQDMEASIRLFALKYGYRREWLLQQQSAMEDLYGREFTQLEAAVRCAENLNWLQTENYLQVEFAKAFFSPFPSVRAIELPPVHAFVKQSPVVAPQIIQKETNIEAWKYHLQQMVLLPYSTRIEYLFDLIPEGLKEEIQNAKDKRFERRNEIAKRNK